jgi:hypothetical protein
VAMRLELKRTSESASVGREPGRPHSDVLGAQRRASKRSATTLYTERVIAAVDKRYNWSRTRPQRMR